MGEVDTIAVVGAGFSGTMVAVRILESAPVGTNLILLNRSGRMARGVAYGTRTAAHVLNVPAGRMSAYPEDEAHFLRFARERLGEVGAGDFVPRAIYGDYLEWILTRAIAEARDRVLVRQLVAEAIDLRSRPGGRRVELLLDDGGTVVADRVVLAVGNYPPADPVLATGRPIPSERYVRDPWAPDAFASVRSGHRVCLVGTGLTMLDVAVDLADRFPGVRLEAISRRGLVPAPHRPPGVAPTLEHRPRGIETGPATALAYFRSVREQLERIEPPVDWRDVIAALRPITPLLWQRLDERERSRFLRHLRPYWEVCRHRAAPGLVARVGRLHASGSLAIRAGRLLDVRPVDRGLRVSWRRRVDSVLEGGTFDWLVNCTGPESRMDRVADPLIGALQRQGLVAPDPHGLGLLTSSDHALLDREGRASSRLYHVGPLLRATLWEATAVPELRVHALTVARAVLASSSSAPRPALART
jgi:uncharacterized NAD(P)/FAD-binding protein YdhS